MFRKIEYIISKIIKKLHLRAIVNSDIHITSKICAGSHLVNVEMGKYSDIGYDCTIIHTKIGSFCSFGANINVGGANHTVEWVSTSPVFNENRDHLPYKFSYHKFNPISKTVIGNDVWIGNNVMIKAGLSIGNGVVIGMGSVVTKDIGSYEIWAGNPAKLIRKRFSDDVIEKLEITEWWNWDDKDIAEYSSLFNDITGFVNKYENESKNKLRR